MAKKVFTTESLKTFVDEIKAHVLNAISVKADITLVNTKQNKLGWVTDANIEDMFAGIYEGVENEEAEDVITGYVDENNNIIVSGDLANGTYYIKYEMEDGSTVDIGELVVAESEEPSEPEEPKYTNLADPTSADWKTGYRLNSSGGITEADGTTSTNYIGLLTKGDIVRIEGLNVTGTCHFVKSDKTFFAEGSSNLTGSSPWAITDVITTTTGVQFTVNNDEVVWCRFAGTLIGTADDVIITINQPITDNAVYYPVTNNLTNCTNSNRAVNAANGERYSASISANEGYAISSIIVTMGGVDISSTAVSDNIISIAEVTGDIVIAAMVVSASYTNLADPTSADWIAGGRIGSDGTNRTNGTATGAATNYIPVNNGDVVRVRGAGVDTVYNQGLYNANKSVVAAPSGDDVSTYWSDISLANDSSQFTINSDSVKYVRLTLKNIADANNVIITVNEPI